MELASEGSVGGGVSDPVGGQVPSSEIQQMMVADAAYNHYVDGRGRTFQFIITFAPHKVFNVSWFYNHFMTRTHLVYKSDEN